MAYGTRLELIIVLAQVFGHYQQFQPLFEAVCLASQMSFAPAGPTISITF